MSNGHYSKILHFSLTLMMIGLAKSFQQRIMHSRRLGFALNPLLQNQYHGINNNNKCLAQLSFISQSCPNEKWSRTTLYSTTSPPATTSVDSDSTIKGIDWVQNILLGVLEETFDPAEVARGAALAKLNKGKKKKKKKKNADELQKDEEPELTAEQKQAIGDAAAEAAEPFNLANTMVTPATKLEFGDYQCNAAMGLAKNIGMNPR